MNEKLFLYVGVAEKKGQYKVRWANNEARIIALEKDGQRDIRLLPLPHAMSKLDSVLFIKDFEDFADEQAQSAIIDFLSTNKVVAKPVVKPTPVVAAPLDVSDVIDEMVYEDPFVMDVVDEEELDDMPF